MINAQNDKRPRARDLGLRIGVLPTGYLNSITDVTGVKIGHTTIIRGTDIRTGVTAVIPHGGNLFQEKVPGAVFVGNGFGKLMGSTQIDELGEIETPVLLTSTLAVPKVGDYLIDYMLGLPGNENVRSINPLVAETNDGYLNDIRGRHISKEDVFGAIESASGGAVKEGSIGAGTGTVAFGWKGGIGTSSRKLPASLGGYTVGVLVQTNFGGVLQINGAPVGEELQNYYLRDQLGLDRSKPGFGKETDLNDNADGSIIIVVATDAPIDARNLKRIAARAMMGLARTGAAGTNGSGDYAIAFSTAESVRIKRSGTPPADLLSNNSMSPLFLATIEATEEAIYNSLFKASTVTGINGNKADALPIDKTTEILKKYLKIE
ncbi:MAG: P1 family peptidase [Acidobacteria bacterium]|nr:P1 family peptidase [Acidobacteriota bacterium]